MSHGFRGSSDDPARQFVDFQRLLNKEGFSVLRFDQPNSGNSDGSKRKAYSIIKNYFTPGMVVGKITNPLGESLEDITIKT